MFDVYGMNTSLIRTETNFFINTSVELPEYPEDTDLVTCHLNMSEYSVLKNFWKRTLDEEGANKNIITYAVKKLLIHMDKQLSAYTLGAKRKEIKIVLDGGKTSSTDGLTIRLTTKHFKSEDVIYAAHLFLAHFYHELCHLLYTDFNVFTGSTIYDLERKANWPGMIKGVVNVLEDERIEQKFIEEYSRDNEALSFFNFWVKKELTSDFDYEAIKAKLDKKVSDTQASINVVAGSSGSKEQIKERQSMLNNMLRWFVLYFTVRYPSDYILNVYLEHSDNDVRNVCSTFYKDLERVLETYGKMLNDINDVIELALHIDGLFEKCKRVEEFPDWFNSILQQLDFGHMSELSDEAEDEANKVAVFTVVETGSILEEVAAEVSTSGFASGGTFSNERAGAKFNAGCPYASTKNSDRRARMEEVRKDVGKNYTALRKLLVTKSFEHSETFKGFRNGKLDSSKLVSGFLGDQNIYYNKAVTQVDKLSLVIIVDQSGSMDGRGKIEGARKTVYMLCKAFEGLKSVELYVYGYTSDKLVTQDINDNNDIFVYTEGVPLVDINFIASIEALSNNRDGVCYDEIFRRVSKLTNNPVLSFIISDGNPCASSYDNGIAHTKSIIDKWSDKGFFICQIAIDSTDSSKMYKHYVDFRKSTNLAMDIVNYVKNKVLNRLKSKIRYEH